MKSISSALVLVAMVLALTFPTAVPVTLAAPKPQPVPASPLPERHPEIRAAINSLEHARVHLREAAHDFGGHRVEALKTTDAAIQQLQICLQYDK